MWDSTHKQSESKQSEGKLNILLFFLKWNNFFDFFMDVAQCKQFKVNKFWQV